MGVSVFVRRWKFSFVTLLALIVGNPLAPSALAAEASPYFTYQGLLTDTGGTRLTDTIDLRLGIYDPSGNCLLYREQQNGIDLSVAEGTFSVRVGSSVGDGKRNHPNGTYNAYSMARVFANDSTFNFPSDATYCPGGYTAGVEDGRVMQVEVRNPTITGSWVALTPNQAVDSVPSAIVAQTLQGYQPSDFVFAGATGNVTTTMIQTGAINSTTILDGTIVAADIANDTITATQIAANAVGASELADNAVDTNAIQNGAVTLTKLAVSPCVNGEILKVVGGVWACSADAGGTTYTASTGLTMVGSDIRIAAQGVTNTMISGIAANCGSGQVLKADAAGGFTCANDIGAAAGSVGGTEIANNSITNAHINAAAAIVDTKLATISTAGKVSGSAITSGTIGGTTIINTSGAITGGAFTSTSLTSSGAVSGAGLTSIPIGVAAGDAGRVNLRELAVNGTNVVRIKAPDVLGGDVVLTFPDNDGTTAGQVLTTDGAGILTWETPSTSVGVGGLNNLNQLAAALCPPNQVLKVNGAGTAWICDSDQTGGAGTGDIDDVTAGSGLSGGGTSGPVTLSIANLGVTNAMLAANAVNSAKIQDGTVGLADMANLAASTLIGRNSGSTGVPEAVTLGTGLSMSAGGVLSSTITDTNTTYTAGTGLNLTGTVFSIPTGGVSTTEILDATIANADIAAAAGIVDTKLATISTAGKVSGSAITSGTIGGSTSMSTTGNIATTGTGTITSAGAFTASDVSNLIGNVDLRGVLYDSTGNLTITDTVDMTGDVNIIGAGSDLDVGGNVSVGGNIGLTAAGGFIYNTSAQPIGMRGNVAVQAAGATANALRLQEGSLGANFIALRAPDSVTGDVTLIFPDFADTPVAGDALRVTSYAGGIATLEWSPASGGAGDITDVVAGNGLTGGATTGSATLDIGAGSGITVNANDIAISNLGVTNAMLAANAVNSAKIQDGTVGLADLANLAASTLIGRNNGSTGVPEAVTLGTGLAMSAGGVLSSTITDTNTTYTAGTGLNLTGTVFSIPTGGVSTTEILNATIDNADIAAAAGIVDTKLATISTAGKVSGAAITSGTIAGSTVWNTSGAITTSGNIATTGTGTITSAGAFTASGTSTLTGNVDLRGVLADSTGNLTVTDNVDLTGALAVIGTGTSTVQPPSGAGTFTFRLPSSNGTSGHVLQTDGSGNTSWVAVSGGSGDITDVVAGAGLTGGATTGSATVDIGAGSGITVNANDIAISNLGVTTAMLAADAVTSAKILNGEIVNADINAAAAIADTKLATISTAGKVSGSAITSGTIAGTTVVNTSGTITGAGIYSTTSMEAESIMIDSGDLSMVDGNIVMGGGSINTGGGSITTTGGTVTASAYYHTSDRRLKKDIVTYADALNTVSALRGVRFNWKKNNEAEVGFIAQEVEAVDPTLITTGTDEMKTKAVKYANITAILVEAIKELRAKLDHSESENELLKERLANIERRLDAQAEQVAAQADNAQNQNRKPAGQGF